MAEIVSGRGLPVAEVARSWTVPRAARDVQVEIERRLEGELGFCVIKGLRPAENDDTDAAAILLLSLLLGTPVSQTRRLDFIGRVEDLGLEATDPRTRGHQTSAELAFHCDRADRLVLYCIRPAMAGGHSRLVSMISAAEIMEAEYPDLAGRLFREVPQDMRVESGAGDLAWCALPVFARDDGAFVGRYLRRFIMDSQMHPAAPRLDEKMLTALAQLDEILSRPGQAVQMALAAGDVQIINNNVVLHARTAFVDDREEKQRRLLLRVWLSHRSSRPLPATFKSLYGNTAAGSYRGGVWPVV
jgi:hypothetical protein